MEASFRTVWQSLDISFDDFIRTTQERHRVGVTALVRRIADAGDLYEGAYEGWYCVSCEAFKQEKDLVDGNCPVHRKAPQWIKEKNYFFRLSKYRQRLLEHYASHPDFLQPDIRRNEILRFLEAGLEDISMSRTGQAWGIPLPHDSDSVVYVWVDALINYLSAVGFGADDECFETWWPASLHVIGKDITRFHCVIWPAMLMSAGLALPHQVFGHGWVHWKGQKMSKSLGTVLDPLEAAERFGPDPLRLYLTKEIAYGQDGDFTWERFEDRYNVDLANNLGNLVSRFSSMVHRYRQGRLQSPSRASGPLAAHADVAVRRYQEAMDVFALHRGIAAAFELIDSTNEFIASVQPWAVAKDVSRAAELDQQLYDVGEAIRIAAVLLWPVMPTSCTKILARVGETRDVASLRLVSDTQWSTSSARVVTRGDSLWPRLDTRQEPASLTIKTNVGQENNAMEQSSPQISLDDFTRIDLQIGRVVSAEPVEKSRKLLKIQLDTGSETRQVVAGIAKTYEPDALVGRTVVFIANLQPAKLAGIESNGMILAASAADGDPVLLTVDNPEAAPPGSKVS